MHGNNKRGMYYKIYVYNHIYLSYIIIYIYCLWLFNFLNNFLNVFTEFNNRLYPYLRMSI